MQIGGERLQFHHALEKQHQISENCRTRQEVIITNISNNNDCASLEGIAAWS